MWFFSRDTVETAPADGTEDSLGRRRPGGAVEATVPRSANASFWHTVTGAGAALVGAVHTILSAPPLEQSPNRTRASAFALGAEGAAAAQAEASAPMPPPKPKMLRRRDRAHHVVESGDTLAGRAMLAAAPSALESAPATIARSVRMKGLPTVQRGSGPPITSDRTSNFWGVYWRTDRKAWCVFVSHSLHQSETTRNRTMHGAFDCEEDAARAYDKVVDALSAHSEPARAARRNFPNDGTMFVGKLQGKVKPKSGTPYSGVCRIKTSSRACWLASISRGGREQRFGLHLTEPEAAQAFDSGMLDLMVRPTRGWNFPASETKWEALIRSYAAADLPGNGWELSAAERTAWNALVSSYPSMHSPPRIEPVVRMVPGERVFQDYRYISCESFSQFDWLPPTYVFDAQRRSERRHSWAARQRRLPRALLLQCRSAFRLRVFLIRWRWRRE